ncbi:hypothetical protein OJF2_78190 [Aquisphaera giovannonii]|uniref:Uncharacterized protein n=1 Tax=Aquisphaera giovannonii TaxID=406548 RepID=A0A5B9WGT0_9BACT|nr:hypothetical protein [Aquisphaera giovannonii]QEH39205.1 hypothetical protein OJF2_78190 [Aquisphaera giovannonii]
MTRQTLSPQRLKWIFLAISAAATVAASAATPGCGGGEPEFDKSALHTPETLVQEFVQRYKNLPERASARAKAAAAKSEKAIASLPDPDAPSGKSAQKEAAVKSKMAPQAQTLDGLIASLDQRLGEFRGISKADAVKQAVAALEKAPELKPDDRKVVVERLSK